MPELFKTILLTSCVGTVFAIFLSVIRPFTQRRFSAKWHYYMWLTVLFVMVLPVRFNIPQKTVEETIIVTKNPTENIEKAVIKEYKPEVDISENVPLNETVTVTENKSIKNPIYENEYLISFIWIFIASILFIIKLVNYFLFLLKIKKYSQSVNYPEVKLYTKRKVRTRESDIISSPFIIGVFRPLLLLPEAEITSKQLHNILAHEITHLKRNDILYKWFVSIVKCIHWFNPAIYFISRKINLDCEISCDFEVVKNMDKDQESSYINTILSLLTTGSTKNISLTTGMSSNKKTLTKRFMMIKNKIKVGKKITVISIISAIVILLTTVLISGVLNGSIFKTPDNSITKLNTDEVKGEAFSLLFIGLDNNNRADTIMLVEFYDNGIKGLSIPRNTVFENRHISDILSEENGTQKLIDTVRQQLSVSVNYYAEIKLTAVKEIVDILGGIEYNVPIDMVYSDPYQDLYINLKKGKRLLNGEQACQLLQFRQGYKKGDLSRIELHQQFLKELIQQKFNKENINKAFDIFKAVSKNIKTNYPIDNLKRDIQMFNKININNIVFETISGENAVDNGILNYEPDTKLSEKENSEFVDGVDYSNQKPNEAEIKIKTTAKSDGSDIVLSHLSLSPEVDLSKIEYALENSGLSRAGEQYANLEKSYIIDKCSVFSENQNVSCDENGNITFYFDKTGDNYIDITFADCETGEVVAEYGVLPDISRSYSFMGFNKNKTYDIFLCEVANNNPEKKIDYIVY